MRLTADQLTQLALHMERLDKLQFVRCPHCHGMYFRCTGCGAFVELDDCESLELDGHGCSVECPACGVELAGERFEQGVLF